MASAPASSFVDDGGDATTLINPQGLRKARERQQVGATSRPRAPKKQVIKASASRFAFKTGRGAQLRTRHDMVKDMAKAFPRRPPLVCNRLLLRCRQKGVLLFSGHQCERLGDQVEVRQPLWLPRITRRRHQASHGRHGRGQGGAGRVRLRRRGKRLCTIALQRSRRHASLSLKSIPICALAGRDGGLSSNHDARRHSAAGVTSTSPRLAISRIIIT